MFVLQNSKYIIKVIPGMKKLLAPCRQLAFITNRKIESPSYPEILGKMGHMWSC